MVFITSPTKGEVAQKLQNNMVSVFLPTTPNPTSGFLLFVNKEDIIELDMSVEQAARMIISGGIINEGIDKKSMKEGDHPHPDAQKK